MNETNTVFDQDKNQFSNIIRSVFGLTKKQFHVFNQIRDCSNQETCVLNLVQMMQSERSIIQKYLKVLQAKGLIFRKSVTLQEFTERCQKIKRNDIAPSTNKGYLYLYTPISDDKIIEKIQAITQDWIHFLQNHMIST